jgi:hypothetical protein
MDNPPPCDDQSLSTAIQDIIDGNDDDESMEEQEGRELYRAALKSGEAA